MISNGRFSIGLSLPSPCNATKRKLHSQSGKGVHGFRARRFKHPELPPPYRLSEVFRLTIEASTVSQIHPTTGSTFTSNVSKMCKSVNSRIEFSDAAHTRAASAAPFFVHATCRHVLPDRLSAVAFGLRPADVFW